MIKIMNITQNKILLLVAKEKNNEILSDEDIKFKDSLVFKEFDLYKNLLKVKNNSHDR